jgi:hypothetical protein
VSVRATGQQRKNEKAYGRRVVAARLSDVIKDTKERKEMGGRGEMPLR